MAKTTPYGALSPGLAELLDRTADRGMRDSRMLERGINPGQQDPLAQRELFQIDPDTGAYISYKGEQL